MSESREIIRRPLLNAWEQVRLGCAIREGDYATAKEMQFVLIARSLGVPKRLYEPGQSCNYSGIQTQARGAKR